MYLFSLLFRPPRQEDCGAELRDDRHSLGLGLAPPPAAAKSLVADQGVSGRHVLEAPMSPARGADADVAGRLPCLAATLGDGAAHEAILKLGRRADLIQSDLVSLPKH